MIHLASDACPVANDGHSSKIIEAELLLATFAIWEYSKDSARYIFGDALGDPVADRILAALKEAPRGMTRTADPVPLRAQPEGRVD